VLYSQYINLAFCQALQCSGCAPAVHSPPPPPSIPTSTRTPNVKCSTLPDQNLRLSNNAGVDLKQRLGRDLEELELAAARESSSEDEAMGVAQEGVAADKQPDSRSDQLDPNRPTGIGVLAPPPDSDEGTHFHLHVLCSRTRCVRSGVQLLVFHMGTWGFSLGEFREKCTLARNKTHTGNAPSNWPLVAGVFPQRNVGTVYTHGSDGSYKRKSPRSEGPSGRRAFPHTKSSPLSDSRF